MAAGLQARLAMSGLPLKDGGAKIAQRVASLTAEIAAVRAGMPTAPVGMRGTPSTSGSVMVPVNTHLIPSQVFPLFPKPPCSQSLEGPR